VLNTGGMGKRTLNIFWCVKPRPGNFGDILSPLILGHYGYHVEHSGVKNANYLCVGSIAKLASKRHTVLGSGIMSKTNKINPKADWKWVRGPITRDIVVSQGGNHPEVLGDPALLLPRIISPKEKKEYKIGIIPHYVDYDYVKETYPQFKVINLLNNDLDGVVKQITDCEKIISSSLHGIIAAHAYKIPAAWVKFSDKLAGDGTKFFDYYASVNLPCEFSTVENPIYTVPNFDDSELHDFLRSGDF